jgi:hypothetical protein
VRLSAGYIAPEMFDRVRWLRPARGPGVPVWHYWTPREKPHLGERVDLATVDPLLRGMVAFAQARGVLTTPSCEGHFFDAAWFDAAYRGLLADVPQIRAGTLWMQDVESGALYRPRIPGWLPPPYAETRDAVAANNGKGQVGFSFPEAVLPRYGECFARSVAPFAEAYAERRGPRTVVTVVVRGSDPDDLRRRWAGVERALHGVLRGVPAVGATG